MPAETSAKPFRIGIVAPGTRIDDGLALRAKAVAQAAYGDKVELVIHAQCFLSEGHFAGVDVFRMAALVEVANDPRLDAVWFARGGYGACRIAEQAIAQMGPNAKAKTFLGYSDAGFILAGLYKAGIGRVAHGPMLVDLIRDGGEAAFRRGLSWLVEGKSNALEKGVTPGHPNIAFNLTVLSNLLGTPLEPNLKGHVLMLEDVGEYMYRIDRAMFHITASANVRSCAGIRLGRISDVPPNTPEFRQTEEQVVRFWCEKTGIAYLGRADIGHDVDNKVAPFGA